jgi:hypothetical protein
VARLSEVIEANPGMQAEIEDIEEAFEALVTSIVVYRRGPLAWK